MTQSVPPHCPVSLGADLPQRGHGMSPILPESSGACFLSTMADGTFIVYVASLPCFRATQVEGSFTGVWNATSWMSRYQRNICFAASFFRMTLPSGVKMLPRRELRNIVQ